MSVVPLQLDRVLQGEAPSFLKATFWQKNFVEIFLEPIFRLGSLREKDFRKKECSFNFCYTFSLVFIQAESIDVKMTFYGLLFVILDSKWRYFYPVSVLVTIENHDAANEVHHKDEFMGIFKVFSMKFSTFYDSFL